MRTEIIGFIKMVRDSFDGAEVIYTNGSCVKFAMILKYLYPKGRILYDLSHAIFEYESEYYDINGHAKCTEHHIPIEEYGILNSYRSMNLKYSVDNENRSKFLKIGGVFVNAKNISRVESVNFGEKCSIYMGDLDESGILINMNINDFMNKLNIEVYEIQ